MNNIEKILTRGVEEIIPRNEFISNLNKNHNLNQSLIL